MTCIARQRLPGKYHLQVQFQHQTAHLLGRLWIWLLTGGIFLLVLAYFSYSLYLMRREKRIADMRKDLINHLAHELQTPITNIGLASEALSEAAGNAFSKEKTQQYAGIIRQENERLKAQVDRVLEIALLAPRHLQLRRREIDLKALMQTILPRYAPLMDARAGTLTADLPPTPTWIEADPWLLEQVLHNLLDNAIKYSPQKPQITLLLKRVESGWELSVQDRGRGIRQRDIPHIFEAFYRVPEGDRPTTRGFGLGLCYAQSIIEAHGGRIAVESTFGQGSRFSFVI